MTDVTLTMQMPMRALTWRKNDINFAENSADTPCLESQNDVNEDLSNSIISNIETTALATVKSAGFSTATQANLPSQSDTSYHRTCTEHGVFDGAELAKFIAPGLSADVVEKVSFIKSHPCQPSSTAASLPFDIYRVYNRTISTAVSPDCTVPREMNFLLLHTVLFV